MISVAKTNVLREPIEVGVVGVVIIGSHGG